MTVARYCKSVSGGGSTVSRPLTPLRRFEWALVSLVAQASLVHGAVALDGLERIVPVLLPAAHLLLIPFLLSNSSFWGIRLIALGLALNVLVMAANGGLMPVSTEAVDAVGRHETESLVAGSHIEGTKNVYLHEEDVRLAILSDRLILPLPRPFTRAASMGDVAIVLGVALACLEATRRIRQHPPQSTFAVRGNG
jgi:hypothetical protein